jgi:hypothetical protein
MPSPSVIAQRVAGALTGLVVPDCEVCTISFGASALVLRWHDEECVELEAGGVTWELDPDLEGDLVVARMETCPAHSDVSTVTYRVAPPWITDNETPRYRHLRRAGFTIDQVTTLLRFRRLRQWIFTPEAAISCELLVELRTEAQLDPTIPDEWMQQLEWLAKHAPALGPKASAAVVFGSRIDLPRA